MPDGLDWWQWRLLTSNRLSVTMTELAEVYSLPDAEQAHLALDLLDDLETLANART